MRRYALPLTVAAAAIALTGCGTQQDPEPAATVTVTSTPTGTPAATAPTPAETTEPEPADTTPPAAPETQETAPAQGPAAEPAQMVSSEGMQGDDYMVFISSDVPLEQAQAAAPDILAAKVQELTGTPQAKNIDLVAVYTADGVMIATDRLPDGKYTGATSGL